MGGIKKRQKGKGWRGKRRERRNSSYEGRMKRRLEGQNEEGKEGR